MPFNLGRRMGGWGRGGRRGGKRSRPPDYCVCPACGSIVPHKIGLPCFHTRCPKCGSIMTRKFSGI